jgi:hypothetical protein
MRVRIYLTLTPGRRVLLWRRALTPRPPLWLRIWRFIEEVFG